MGKHIVSGINQCAAFTVRRSEHLELRTSNPPSSHLPNLSCSGIPHVQAIYLSPLNLFLLRWLFLDIEDVLLEPVARCQDDLPPFPSAPGPPPKAISKRDNRRWSASTWRMLKIVALVRLATLKEAAIEVIV